MKHQHILVIRFSALGDVAMTVPIVWAVAKRYPDVRITVLSRPFARTFFENLAPNVNFMEADLKGEYKGIHGLNALYRRLTAKQFTHVADLHSVLRSEYLRMRFNLGHFKVKHIDKHRKMRRQLVKQNNKRRQPMPTSFDNYTEEHLADFDNYDALLACWPSAEITCVEALVDGSVNIYC